jgi:hypothetical protein
MQARKEHSVDPIAILALVLFVAMVVSWFVLPGAAGTGMPAESVETVTSPAAKQPI